MSDQSGRNFEPVQEAAKLEMMAKDRLDHANRPDLSEKLANEFASLTYEQRCDTWNALNKYINWKVDALPTPSIVDDKDGKFIGIEFEASLFDWHNGPHKIRMTAENGEVEVQRNRVFIRPFYNYTPWEHDATVKEPKGTLEDKYHGPHLHLASEGGNPPGTSPDPSPMAPAGNS